MLTNHHHSLAFYVILVSFFFIYSTWCTLRTNLTKFWNLCDFHMWISIAIFKCTFLYKFFYMWFMYVSFQTLIANIDRSVFLHICNFQRHKQRKKTLHQTILYDQMIKSNWNRRVDDLIFVLFCFLFYSKLIYTMSIKRSNPTTCDIMCKCNSNKNRQEIEKRKEKKKKKRQGTSVFLIILYFNAKFIAELDIMWILFLPQSIPSVSTYTSYADTLIYYSLFHYFIISIIKSHLFNKYMQLKPREIHSSKNTIQKWW